MRIPLQGIDGLSNARPTVYQRTGLAIWPQIFNGTIENGESFSEWVMEQIEQTTSAKSTPLEDRLIEYLLASADDKSLLPSTVASIVCNAAITWKDLALWRRGLESSGGDYNTTLCDLAGALRAFGFDSVRAV